MQTETVGDYTEIRLTCGGIAKVSNEDADRVYGFKWRTNRHGYVRANIGGRVVQSLHRFILSAPRGMHVHHLNESKLDCRRENLLLLTNSEHQRRFHAEQTKARNNLKRIHPLTKVCAYCGKTFTPNVDRRGAMKVCSATCGANSSGRMKRKLTAADAEFVRRSFGTIRTIHLAARFGVNRSTIVRIAAGDVYREVGGNEA